MNVLAILEGSSWTQCEDIDLQELEGENGLDVLLARLDKQWQYDDRVETSNIFDNFFFKVQRKTGQTLMEYVTEFHQALREVSRLKVSLPDEITGWLLLRRAALTKDQQHLVQTQVGRNLTLKNVEQSMYQVFGQDYRQTYLPNTNKAKGFAKGKGRQHIMHADDSYDDGSEWQEFYETDEVYWDAAGESPDHEEYYDPNDETWDDTYYETEESYQDESLFDIQEYDEAYTAYTDAKQRIQQLRQARGFYPVVALMDNKQMPLAASGAGSPKGKGKKSKKPSEAPPYAKGKGPKARAKSFFGKDVCLRCGKTGHRAANCTQPSSSSASGSSKKRVIDLDPMVNMVFHQQSSSSGENDEFFETEEAYAQGEALVRAGGWITKDADMCVQDQGASSFLAGSEYILRYLKWLEIKGYPMDDIVFKRCDKSFRFGGDAEGHSRWMVELPVFISNTPGRMQCFVIFGATPMLLGRPVLEQLGAVVDFGAGKMRILGGQWTNIKRGKQDAMLLKLADNVQNISDFKDPRFDLRAKDDDHSKSEHLRDFLSDLRAEGRYDEMQSEVQFAEDPDDEVFYEVESYINVEDDASDEIFSKDEVVERDQCAMTKTWVWMQGQLTATNRRTAALANEARDPAQPRKKLIWEVYSGTGLLGEMAELMGAEVMRFGLHNGWDFTKSSQSSHRRQLLLMADELEPDEIYMSPKCTLWSQMQAINIHNDADWQDLQERRHYDHEVHLKFCRKLYLRQVRRGAHAHCRASQGKPGLGNTSLEQPSRRTNNLRSVLLRHLSQDRQRGLAREEADINSHNEASHVQDHVTTLHWRSSTCKARRWESMQEDRELPSRAFLAHCQGSHAWRRTVWTGLRSSTRSRSTRAYWHSAEAWHSTQSRSYQTGLQAPSKSWTPTEGNSCQDVAGQEVQSQSHCSGRGHGMSLLQQVRGQETISTSTCRKTHRVQRATAGWHHVDWPQFHWWRSKYHINHFQRPKDCSPGDDWHRHQVHGSTNHPWWDKWFIAKGLGAGVDQNFWSAEAA